MHSLRAGSWSWNWCDMPSLEVRRFIQLLGYITNARSLGHSSLSSSSFSALVFFDVKIEWQVWNRRLHNTSQLQPCFASQRTKFDIRSNHSR